MKDVDEYQSFTKTTAVYTGEGGIVGLMYVGLGLAGEAGEVANKIKKIARDDDGVISPEKAKQIKKELGDVCWYLARVADEIECTMSDVLSSNIEKLSGRKERGTLKGDGDDR